MEYLTTDDLETFEFLLKSRIDSLQDRAGTLHAFERHNLIYLRDIRERLIMELKADIEKGMN